MSASPPPWPPLRALLQERLGPSGAQPALACLRSDGRPAAVLFVHGACCTASVWTGLMQSLRSLGLPSAALNLRGHGDSDGQADLQRWGMADYEEDVLRAIDALGEPEPLLVGHSMGGLVAQRVASRARLRGLVLLASSPVQGMRVDGWRMALRHPASFLAAARARSFLRLYRDPRVCRSLLLGPAASPALLQQLRAQLVEESWRAGQEMNTARPDPQAVRCPVTVVGGSADAMVSPASVRRTARAYGVSPQWLPDCGHMLPLEAPRTQLALLIARCWSEGQQGERRLA